MWQEYVNAETIDEGLTLLSRYGNKARVIAGGTDLILELERGVRKDIHTLIDITRIPGLDQISLDNDGRVHLGPMVTHNHCVASPIIRSVGLPLALASWEVGAPQIRNRSTIAGNIITASPANDTITPLMVMDAQITLRSSTRQRVVPFADFYTGFRKTVMASDELLVDISFSGLRANQRGMYVKLGLRRAQAISIVHVAVVLTFDHSTDTISVRDRVITEAKISLGSVTPVVERAEAAEEYLAGKIFSQDTIEKAAQLAQKSATPIDDVRGSAAYRMEMVRICVLRSLRAIFDEREKKILPEKPVLLWGENKNGIGGQLDSNTLSKKGQIIQATINGKKFECSTGHDKTLLRWLREDVGLTGTKEGCAEGECGACTVFLDGVAVMSCLVPAPRAHGAEIVTIEGLSSGYEDQLHPVQQAFIDDGAVQCGYCTPGFIMSAAKLLQEIPQPTHDQIRQAITGNFCRCTGYYKIVNAMAKAAGGAP